MDDKVAGPEWQGRKIAKDEDKHDLESRAAVFEFKHRMARPDAEHRAHHEYKQDKHREAAAYHLQGLKASQGAGSLEEGHKHGMMYQLHMKALGLDPMGPVPHEIQGLADKQDKFYKFKPHRADNFLLGDSDQSVKKSELQKGWPKDEKENQENAAVHPIMEDALLEHGAQRAEVPDKNPAWAPSHFQPGIGYTKEAPLGVCKGCGTKPVTLNTAFGSVCPECYANSDTGLAALRDIRASGNPQSGVPSYAAPGTDEVVWHGLNQDLKYQKSEQLVIKSLLKNLQKGDVIPFPKKTQAVPASWDSAVKETAAAGPQAAGNVSNIAPKIEARKQLARTRVQNTLEDAAGIMAQDPGFQAAARQRDAQAKEAKLKAGGQLYRPGQKVVHVDQQSIPWVGTVKSAAYRENDIDGPGHYYEVGWHNPKQNQTHEDYLHQDLLRPHQ